MTGTDGKNAVVIFVPFPQLVHYQKLIKEKGLLEELEKKFSGKTVLILAKVCPAHRCRAFVT